ncbi:MAG: alpha/beta fold hydrolase [Acidimicrobiia bacterium]|nr:alpha/beta fold hydrolase [Acidimicrobiia bacterium]
MAASRSDVRIATDDGTVLAGWLYQPSGDGPHPAVVLSHGFSALMVMGLDPVARAFADAGFVAVAYDHRNYGESEGTPRHESDPWRQVADMRDVLTWVSVRDDVDEARVGIWGTSYAGGHVLTVAGLDRRVGAVVSQVPLVRGEATYQAWIPERARERFAGRLDDDRAARLRGEAAQTVKAATPGSETEEWVAATDDGTYANEVTIRSFELLRSYEPESFVARIAPTPLLMVIAAHDTQTPTQWQREAFELAGQPSRLIELDCRHYDPYTSHLEPAVSAARDWFVEHLGSPSA